MWFKIDSLTVTTYQLIMRVGATGSNGTGFYLDTSRHLHFTTPASTPNDVDTGYVWPDTNFHLVDWVSQPTTINRVYIDGVAVWSASFNTTSAPSPNTLGYGCDGSADASKNAVHVAWPAFYPFDLSVNNIKATYLARTDPDAALDQTAQGGAAADSTLQLILQSVRKTYTAP